MLHICPGVAVNFISSPFVKADFVRTLGAYKLSVRSRSSVEMHFMNPSRVENTTLKTSNNIFYRIETLYARTAEPNISDTLWMQKQYLTQKAGSLALESSTYYSA